MIFTPLLGRWKKAKIFVSIVFPQEEKKFRIDQRELEPRFYPTSKKTIVQLNLFN